MKGILDADQSYTFSRYAELAFNTEDILTELGVSLERAEIQFQVTSTSTQALKDVLKKRLARTDLESEMARRETLIAPILFEAAELANAQLKIEYPIQVSNYLKGTLDYYLQSKDNLLVVEAKNADLSKGFTQMAVELIALDQWTDSHQPVLHGAVTTGEEWRFGQFFRQEKRIVRDLNLYGVPRELDIVMGILLGILISQG